MPDVQVAQRVPSAGAPPVRRPSGRRTTSAPTWATGEQLEGRIGQDQGLMLGHDVGDGSIWIVGGIGVSSAAWAITATNTASIGRGRPSRGGRLGRPRAGSRPSARRRTTQKIGPVGHRADRREDVDLVPEMGRGVRVDVRAHRLDEGTAPGGRRPTCSRPPDSCRRYGRSPRRRASRAGCRPRRAAARAFRRTVCGTRSAACRRRQARSPLEMPVRLASQSSRRRHTRPGGRAGEEMRAGPRLPSGS